MLTLILVAASDGMWFDRVFLDEKQLPQQIQIKFFFGGMQLQGSIYGSSKVEYIGQVRILHVGHASGESTGVVIVS